MSLQIGSPPSSDFTDPLGLMMDCHRRIERFLGQMIAAMDDAPAGRLSEAAQAAMAQALRYFRSGSPLHTTDEEESLFPRLRSSGSPDAQSALSAIDRLEVDHRAAEEAHAEIDSLSSRWLETGSLPTSERDRLRQQLERLRELYARHIGIEDRELFPAAAKALDRPALLAIGREMAARRGLDPDNLPAAPRCSSRKAE